MSISRRTDIPAWFTPWLLQRIRAGFVMVRNPRNLQHVMRVSLKAEDVVAVVFWSRDYAKLIPHLSEFDDRDLRPCFHLTLTGYGPPLERNVPAAGAVLNQFEQLAARYGRDRVIWRYDPIVLGTGHDVAAHVARFEELATHLSTMTARCVVSFLDLYPSTQRAIDQLARQTGERFPAPSVFDRARLAQSLVSIGAAFGIKVSACCEPGLVEHGVGRARCIDPDLIRSFARNQRFVAKEAPTRRGCGCVLARDIGAYHTCAHGCVYCYANSSPEEAIANARAAQPTANCLGPHDIEPHVVGSGCS